MNKLPSLKEMRALVSPFATPSNLRGLWETGVTLLLFFSFVLLSGIASQYFLPLALMLAVPTGFLLVRVFILQHDCGHRALFRSAWLNRWVGRLCALLVFTPFDSWKQDHHGHHRDTGRLDVKRGDGVLWLYTVAEFATLSPLRKILYRLYHFPPMLFCIGPVLYFVFYYRCWWFEKKVSNRKSMLATNVALLTFGGLLLLVVDFKTIVIAYMPAIAVASMIGVWLFYVQHSFEHAYFARGDEHDKREAIVKGSSFYKLPWLLDWLTGSIGYHALHHLNPSIPSYRLRKCWEATLHLWNETPTFTIRQSLSLPGLVLWDEEQRKLVRF